MIKRSPVQDQVRHNDWVNSRSRSLIGLYLGRFLYHDENLVLEGKEVLLALNQWDKFDEVTSEIYTLDDPLYMAQLQNEQFRYSGIVRDPYFLWVTNMQIIMHLIK